MCDMDNLSALTIVIPVYNESHEIIERLENELELMGAEVIIVDDGSDVPYPYSVMHRQNKGYGAAIMTGIQRATRPLVLTMDGDGQHRVQDVLNLFKVWNMIDADMIIGARRLEYEEPLRMFGRKVLNFIASILSAHYLQDLNSGFRIFKRDIAVSYFSILCKKFSFTTSLTMSMLCDNLRVESFPIKVSKRKYGNSHVKIVKDGFITLYYIFRIGIALRTRKIRAWLRSHQWWMRLTGKA